MVSKFLPRPQPLLRPHHLLTHQIEVQVAAVIAPIARLLLARAYKPRVRGRGSVFCIGARSGQRECQGQGQGQGQGLRVRVRVRARVRVKVNVRI